MNKKNVPFEFIFDYFIPIEITIKPMFGMFGVYVINKLVLMLSHRKGQYHYNGIWVATRKKYHESLINEIPALSKFQYMSGDSVDKSQWLYLSEDNANFEAGAIRVAELIRKGDMRIGRLVKPALRKK